MSFATRKKDEEAYLQDADGGDGFLPAGDDVLENVDGDFLDPVLDQPVRNDDVVEAVLVVSRNGKHVVVVPLKVIRNGQAILQVQTRHVADDTFWVFSNLMNGTTLKRKRSKR